jgi:hypothetical protein
MAGMVKNQAAVELGKRGGSVKSEKKAKAARRNWKKAMKILAAKREQAA